MPASLLPLLLFDSALLVAGVVLEDPGSALVGTIEVAVVVVSVASEPLLDATSEVVLSPVLAVPA